MRGPLNVACPPQGYLVIIQAGSSEDGKELAAQTAEVIFTAQQTLAEAQAFYADVKGRLTKYGRSPDNLKIMPGVLGDRWDAGALADCGYTRTDCRSA